MPRKISNTTKAHLISVPLPQHAATYTVISHQFVMDYATQQLIAAGFNISDEIYRCTADGQIAQGVYRLNYNHDPELSMMFAWTNSYNKQVKFKCVVGAYINNTGSVMTSGDIGNWVRKHTGTADTETKDTIDEYISNADMYYTQLISDKACMEKIDLNTRKQAQLLGVLFGEYEILTTEQASMVRDQMRKPLYVFKNSDSLWAFYNYVTIALQKSHPRTWMEDQRILHYFISTVGNFQKVTAPVVPDTVPEVEENTNEDTEEFVDPNQTSILDQIDSTDIEEAELVSLEPESSNPVEAESTWEIDNDMIGNSDEFQADVEMQEIKTEEVYDLDAEEDEDWDKLEKAEVITEVIVPEATEESTTEMLYGVDNGDIEITNAPINILAKKEVVEDEFAKEDNFNLDFSEDTNEDQDSIPDFF
tara:strand:+ start:3967 stop:5226 length:1260 start_codon:yes stop_codon:yes gene_type:complete